MTLQTKTFTTLVEDQATAIQGGTSRYLVDFSIGSILRAVIEASSAVGMWMQGLVLQLLASTRAATSTTTDLDSWMADYGITRLPAVPATGSVTFSRFTPTLQAVIPVGAKVQTSDGTQVYAVTVDATNTAYSAALGGYVIAAGASSVTVPVSAQTAGAISNSTAGSINTLGQAISGVDTVTNALNFSTGSDAESDPALRTRFVNYVASLSKATKGAITYAVQSLGATMSCTIVENVTYAGLPQMGYFYVVVNDGTGLPPAGTLTSAANAIEAVRPVGSTFGVFAPSVITASISMSITTASGYDHTATAALVNTAIVKYIAGFNLGDDLAWSRLAQIAYDVSPGVTNVTSVLINGGTVDLAATNQQVIVAGLVTVV